MKEWSTKAINTIATIDQYMSTKKVTTIQLRPETKERLKKYGEMGMSYDEVINRILDELDECKKLINKKLKD